MLTFNPIEGMAPSEIIDLFDKAADYEIDVILKEKAIYLVAIHIEETPDQSIHSILNALLESEDLEGFVTVAANCFLPGVTGWQHKAIR